MEVGAAAENVTALALGSDPTLRGYSRSSSALSRVGAAKAAARPAAEAAQRAPVYGQGRVASLLAILRGAEPDRLPLQMGVSRSMVRELRGLIRAMARSGERPREELPFSLRSRA